MNASNIKLIIFDLDGTLFVEDQVVQGAIKVLKLLRAKGLSLRFMTNTTTKTHAALLAQLQNMGFEVDAHELLSAPQAAKHYLQAYQTELGRNLRLWPVLSQQIWSDFTEFQLDMRQPDFILLGDIGESWSLPLINKLFKVLGDGSQLIALHQNKFWQRQDGLHVDIGFFVAGLQYVTAKPAIIMGKPAAGFFQQVLATTAFSASQALVIGDDIDSDIGGAQLFGMQAALVKTGKYRADYTQKSAIVPDLILEKIEDLKQIFNL